MLPSPPPLVSVVIPAQNRADLLARAVASVTAQSEQNFEIIVVDDASSPSLQKPADDKHSTVRILRNEGRAGAQRSRLVGTLAARGEYVALLDSDDWWKPAKLERQLSVLKSGSADLVSCRVVAVRGSLQKEAPWRPLAQGERVEDFLYAQSGMLQTSTVVGRRDTMVELLQQTAHAGVHNDTMLFLEAQNRRLRIDQLADALSFFDDNPRPDRVSYDQNRVQASQEWFRSVSEQWSTQAQRGFHLTDTIPRLVNTGQRRQALACLFSAYHPKINFIQYCKKFAYIMFNGSPSASIRRIDDRLREMFDGQRTG